MCGSGATSSATGSTRPRPEDDPNAAQTDPDLIATAYFARSAAVLARAARLVGEHGLADHYEVLAREVRETWQRTYVTPAGLVHSDSQTAYAIAIAWDLLATDGQRRTAGRRVADLVRVNAFRVGSGFVGTPLVPEALVIAGLPCGGPSPAAPDQLSIVALPGHHGSYDHLGAVGQHAPRRQRQRERHDLLQPLRPRCGRGLAPPQRRRTGAGRSRVSPHRGEAPAPGGPDLGDRSASHSIW